MPPDTPELCARIVSGVVASGYASPGVARHAHPAYGGGGVLRSSRHPHSQQGQSQVSAAAHDALVADAEGQGTPAYGTCCWSAHIIYHGCWSATSAGKTTLTSAGWGQGARCNGLSSIKRCTHLGECEGCSRQSGSRTDYRSIPSCGFSRVHLPGCGGEVGAKCRACHTLAGAGHLACAEDVNGSCIATLRHGTRLRSASPHAEISVISAGTWAAAQQQ